MQGYQVKIFATAVNVFVLGLCKKISGPSRYAAEISLTHTQKHNTNMHNIHYAGEAQLKLKRL